MIEKSFTIYIIQKRGLSMDNLTIDNIVSMYYYIALFATIFYIIKIFTFTFFGGDVEVHSDFNSSFETDDSFEFLSIQSILAFLMGFGWIGLSCIKVWNMRILLTGIVSLIFGFLLMFISAYLMFCIKKLNKRVVKDLSKAVGLSAKAYTNFAPGATGQIEIDINNHLSIEEAVNCSQESINAFDSVKVVKYENNILCIEKL